ncbi:hypothetical protein CCR85_03355 [Rhodothalassium salexigens]|uniref:phasin family protein n=1 Tax=Rhodothalassium salexigens TaxID=1086 RepID=UPI00191230EC|nr:phasin family protein [Rhodothalassium salexigens]MBK5910528.1 hypothetical protein [Rhodothalassium salexigens]MBK5919857.1 hypothetical protein [Rhodothalassium salexigens]
MTDKKDTTAKAAKTAKGGASKPAHATEATAPKRGDQPAQPPAASSAAQSAPGKAVSKAPDNAPGKAPQAKATKPASPSTAPSGGASKAATDTTRATSRSTPADARDQTPAKSAADRKDQAGPAPTGATGATGATPAEKRAGGQPAKAQLAKARPAKAQTPEDQASKGQARGGQGVRDDARISPSGPAKSGSWKTAPVRSGSAKTAGETAAAAPKRSPVAAVESTEPLPPAPTPMPAASGATAKSAAASRSVTAQSSAGTDIASPGWMLAMVPDATVKQFEASMTVARQTVDDALTMVDQWSDTGRLQIDQVLSVSTAAVDTLNTWNKAVIAIMERHMSETRELLATWTSAQDPQQFFEANQDFMRAHVDSFAKDMTAWSQTALQVVSAMMAPLGTPPTDGDHKRAR